MPADVWIREAMSEPVKQAVKAPAPEPASGGGGADPDEALAAALTSMEFGVDFDLDSKFKDTARATPVTADGDLVNSITPSKISGATWLYNGSGVNTITHDEDDQVAAGDTIIQPSGTAIGPTDNGSGLVAAVPVATGKYFAFFCFKPAATAGGTEYVVAKSDSSSRLTLRIIPTSDTGKYTAKIGISRAVGGLDNSTVVKEYAHGAVCAVAVFFDGTDLHWQFLGDDPQVSESYAGTLDTLGASAYWWLMGNGGSPGNFAWRFAAMGKTAADNDAQWTILKNAITAIATKEAA